MPMPTESEKNVKPMALSREFAVTWSHFGEKRNLRPSQAPGSVRPRIIRTIISTNSSGMSTLDMRSIPLFTPKIRTPAVMARKRVW